MADQPGGGKPTRFLQCTGLFEQMTGSWDNDKSGRAGKSGESCLIQIQDDWVAASHQQQRGSSNPGQRIARQIRSSSARYHGADLDGQGSCSLQCGSRAGAGPEVTQVEACSLGLPTDPFGARQQPLGEQIDIENIAAIRRLGLGQEVEQQCPQPSRTQLVCNRSIPRAEATAPAAVSKEH